jgi:hypothetical protein
MSLAAAGGEAELFYAESRSGGGYAFQLQHLSAAGSAMGNPIALATGMPQNAPATSVASDGKEITCCWEDFGIDPDPYGTPYIMGITPFPVELVQCNSVPVGGAATDLEMDGGFADQGTDPLVATNAGSTVLVFQQDLYGFNDEQLYRPYGYGAGFGPLYRVTQESIIPAQGEFAVLTSDGGQVDVLLASADFTAVTEPLPLPIAGAGAGLFAAAVSGEFVGFALHVSQGLGTAVFNLDAGTATGTQMLSAATETPLAAVAAGICPDGSLGVAYAATGGTVMFRSVGLNGIPRGTASTLIGNLDPNPTGLALAPSGDGLLLAVGAAGTIGVYSLACP